jgi:hypothetical protein
MGLLTDKKQKHSHQVLTEEKLDDIGARLENTPRKSLKHLAPETRVSKSSARTATQLLKLRLYKTTVIHALQPRSSVSRVHFCSWFPQAVIESEIDLQLTFFLTKLLEFTKSTSNPQSPAPSSENCCLVCCKCKKDFWTCVF